MATPRWQNFSVGEYGMVGQLTLTQDGEAQDISTFTALEFVLKHLDTGNSKTVVAQFATDGTDGVLEYVFEPGDIDAAGRWEVYATLAKDGSFLMTAPHRFSVAL